MIYTQQDIINHIKKSYNRKYEIFDETFIMNTLNDLTSTNKHNINNSDTMVIDKYGTHGYIICHNEYYIFQPFEQNNNHQLESG